MRKITAVFTVLIIIAIWFVVGCAHKGGEFGQPLTETNATIIKNILSAPQQFKGKVVRVEGKIIEECPAGGWFILKDNTGTIYVNLHPSYFAIPQALNHSASAQGKVKVEDNQVSVIGEGVEIK